MRGAYVYLAYLTLVLCHITLSLAWGYRGSDDSAEQKRLLEFLSDVKRTNWIEALCGKWDDWCLPDSKKPGLTCCDNYTCKCNLWNTNCRCKSKLFRGK